MALSRDVYKRQFWDDLPFNLDVMREVERVGCIDGHYYHFLRARAESENTKYRPDMYDKREEEHRWMNELYAYWNLDSPEIEEFLARRYAERLVAVSYTHLDAQSALDSGKREIAANKRTLRNSENTLAQSEAELRRQENQLASASKKIEDGYAAISNGQAQIDEGRAQANAACDDAATQVKAALAAGMISQEEASAQLAGIEAQRAQTLAQLDAQETQLSAAKQELDAQACLLYTSRCV